jgi:hypothetical protein
MKNTLQKMVSGFVVVLSLASLMACGGGCSQCGLRPGKIYIVQYEGTHYELAADDSGCIAFDPAGAQCAQFQVNPVV